MLLINKEEIIFVVNPLRVRALSVFVAIKV